MDKYRPYNNKELKNIRQKLRNSLSGPELMLWSRLRGKQLNGIKFRRQYGIDEFIVDFYCSVCRLAIEIDGDSHYSEEARNKDLERDKRLNFRGIKILRFTNAEVMENCEGVLARIVENLKSHTTPNPS